MLNQKAKKITQTIYKGWGSGTGYLFGIEPARRYVVEAIVRCVLKVQKGIYKDESKEHTD